jgi:hypothetical protein
MLLSNVHLHFVNFYKTRSHYELLLEGCLVLAIQERPNVDPYIEQETIRSPNEVVAYKLQT